MWGNLAGRIANTDLNATLEKIGNAVAPREEDYEDDDEEYDEEDEEYEDEGEEYEEEDNNAAPSFGLVGMLTRALDERERQVEDEGVEEEDGEGQCELDFDSAPETSQTEAKPLLTAQRSDLTPVPVSNDLGRPARNDPIQHLAQPKDDWSDDDNDTQLQERQRFEAVIRQDEEERARLQLEEAQKKKRMEMEQRQKEEEARQKAAEERYRQAAEARQQEQLRLEAQQRQEEEELRKVVLARQQAEADRQKKIQADEAKRLAEEQEILRLEAEATRKAEHARERRRQEAEAKKKAAAEEKRGRDAAEARRKEEERRRVAETQRLELDEENRRQKLAALVQEDEDNPPLAANGMGQGGQAGQNGDISRQPPTPEYHESTRLMETEFKCRELQTRLEMAEQEMEAMRNEAKREKERAEAEKEDLISRFQDKESRLLKATSEENQNHTLHIEQEFKARIEQLEQTLLEERKRSNDEREEHKRSLMESDAKYSRAESQIQATVKRFETEISQMQQREERALRKADDRVAQTMAVLDERNEEITHLKALIRDMESKVNEHEEGVEEAEEELDELQHENDSLRGLMEKLEQEKEQLKEKLETLEHDSEKLAGLQMEMTMVKEDLTRERTKNQTVVDSAITSHSQLESERDSALSELRDIKQQLAATLGDLEVARADNERIMTANGNLQNALEAFQDERQAEMKMIDEQRLEAEEGIKSAHEAAVAALKQTHEAQLYEVQIAANKTVQNAKNEMELLEGNIERLKSENNQMRRSLDEAIHRLQSTQEDVIDRNVMKNILLDWCMLKDKTKRHQVLEIMANLLHFSEEEKEKLHLTSVDLDSVRARVVGALAAPLPPSKADVEHLEGDNVREKWINFLLAETDDG